MGAKYKHKTEQLGASFDTDYKVITQCVPDCPACAFKAGIREVVEWLQTKREGGYNFCVKASWDEWQVKLKEWG